MSRMHCLQMWLSFTGPSVLCSS